MRFFISARRLSASASSSASSSFLSFFFFFFLCCVGINGSCVDVGGSIIDDDGGSEGGTDGGGGERCCAAGGGGGELAPDGNSEVSSAGLGLPGRDEGSKPAAKSYARFFFAAGVGDEGGIMGGNVCDALALGGVGGRANGVRSGDGVLTFSFLGVFLGVGAGDAVRSFL